MRDKKGRFVKGHLVAGRVRDKLGRFVKMDMGDKKNVHGEQSMGGYGHGDRYFEVVKEVDEFLKRLEGVNE
jgi:hypothetical protein